MSFLRSVVEAGVDVNRYRKYYSKDTANMVMPKTLENETVLHRAIKCGNVDLVKFLVGKGANVNAPCRYSKLC